MLYVLSQLCAKMPNMYDPGPCGPIFYLLDHVTRRSKIFGFEKKIFSDTVGKMLVFGVIKGHWKKFRFQNIT